MPTRLIEVGTVWGSMIEAFALDPRSRTLAMTVAVYEGGTRTEHVLAAEGVRLCRFFNDYQGPAEVLEATEVFLDPTTDHPRLVIEFWGPDAGLELVADIIRLDGERLDWRARDIARG